VDTNTFPDPSSRRLPLIQSTIPVERPLAGSDTVPAEDLTCKDELFFTAIREGSNLAMDWLWLATQVTTDDQLRYCLQRALRIDPANREIKRELARLTPGSQRRTGIFRW